MKRYKQANEGIHAPEEIKEKAVRPAGRRTYTRWAGAVAAVLAVAIIGGVAAWSGRMGQTPDPLSGEDAGIGRAVPEGGDSGFTQNGGTPKAMAAHALAMADYPEMAPYPKDEEYVGTDGTMDYDALSKAYDAWQESRDALAVNTDFKGEMDGFLTRSTAQFLVGAGGENRVYSPLNVYMALSMLAETAGENSRAQILDLLEADSIEGLRSRATALWRSNYRDDGVVASVLANSLWLRDGTSYSQGTLDILAEKYYASAFSGEMGSEDYNQALRDWLNEQTHGLLKEQTENLKLDPETVLALASTIYFKAAWDEKFDEYFTQREVFRAPSGDVETDFMHSTLMDNYYWGEHFAAVRLPFQMGGTMWFILSDEGYTVDELLESGEAMDFLLADKQDTYGDEGEVVSSGWAGKKYLTINLSMPKFDVSSDLDLIDGLKELGVTDIFDAGVSNFEPLGAGDSLYVSQAKHAARVKVNEEGCEAAAYTLMTMCEGAPMPPDEEVDFVLDRPFLFAITGNGMPLFTGVVNQP